MKKLFQCATCSKLFESRKACKSRTPKYCSSKCYGESIKIHKYCIVCGNEIIVNNASKIHRKYCSLECSGAARQNKPLTNQWRLALSAGRRKSERCKGPNLYNWKGGDENRRQYNTKRYHERRALGAMDKTYLKILFVLQKRKCYYCGGDISHLKAIEHLIPVSRGGDNSWINLVYSCRSCNSKKHDKTLAEFAVENIRPDWLNNMVQFGAHEIRQNYAG